MQNIMIMENLFTTDNILKSRNAFLLKSDPKYFSQFQINYKTYHQTYDGFLYLYYKINSEKYKVFK